MSGELTEALVGLIDRLGRVLEQRGTPQHTVGSVRVVPHTVLDFDGGIEEVQAERLVRVIVNAAHSAERVATYMREQTYPKQGMAISVTNAAAMRYAYTLRDSLAGLARLLGSDEYKLRMPNWLDPEKPVVIHYEPGEEKWALKLADIYGDLKELRDDIPHISTQKLRERMTTIMEKISNG